MKTKAALSIGVLLCFLVNAYTQTNLSIKTEASFLQYRNNTIQIDPGPNWKGYYLEDKNGIDLNLIGGICFKEKLFTGIGFGYVNFEGTNGLSVFSDVEYLPLKTRLTPLLSLKIGYSHIWNQYENGSGTALGELCAGLNVRLTEKTGLYFKSGFLVTQQSLLTPLRLGLRFKNSH